MASKYLSIEEAVELLGIPQEEITRLREAGDLRGFADRGTWKFRSEDIDEFARSRQADSSEELDLGADELVLADDEFDALGTTSLLDDDDEVTADQPTLLQQSTDDEPLISTDDSSDSDVRLVIDESLEVGDVSESDSDVRLVSQSEPLVAESDSEALLAESDSEVRLVPGSEASDAMAGSDSDVKLVAPEQSLDATVIETPRGADELELTEIAEDSGLAVDQDADSGITLEAVAESGISLEETVDSNISLDAAEESGISLEPSAGSGVEIGEVTIADSGISLDMDVESGISLDQGKKADETQLEVPVLVEDGTDFEMAGTDDDEATGTDTSVLLFDDEEDADDYSATVVKKSDDADLFDEFGDIGDDDGLDVVDDDDVFGEDDELEDLDVFDADDDVFDDEEADDDYAVPVERIVATVEQEWGVGTFLGLLTATGLMLVCGMVLFELVKSIWSAEDPGFSGSLIETVGKMFN